MKAAINSLLNGKVRPIPIPRPLLCKIAVVVFYNSLTVTVLAIQIKHPVFFVLVLPCSTLIMSCLGAAPNHEVQQTSLHLILKTNGICNGLHTNSPFFGRLTSIFDKTS